MNNKVKHLSLFFTLFLIFIKLKIYSIDFPEIKGYELSVNSDSYTSENLFEAIDGAAEVFLQYKFKELKIAEYSSTKNKITVEVYEFATLDDAFGIYAAERMPDYKFIDIETEGYITNESLNFFKGKYYFKIYSENKDISEEELIKFANSLSNNIKCENKYPLILKAFPEKYILKRQENYYPSNFMGYSFFKNVFTVHAVSNNDNFKIFISCFETATEACSSLNEYFKYLKINTKCKNNIIYNIQDPVNKSITLLCYDKFIIGVNRPKDLLTEEIIKEIKTRLISMK